MKKLQVAKTEEIVSASVKLKAMPSAHEIDLAQRLAVLTGAASMAAAVMEDCSPTQQCGKNLRWIVSQWGYREGDQPSGKPNMSDENADPEDYAEKDTGTLLEDAAE